jgi:hypothetical protein
MLAGCGLDLFCSDQRLPAEHRGEMVRHSTHIGKLFMPIISYFRVAVNVQLQVSPRIFYIKKFGVHEVLMMPKIRENMTSLFCTDRNWNIF